MTPARQRLDQALVDRGLVETRSKAKAMIMAGQVRVPGTPSIKPGTLVSVDTEVEVLARPRFVSRGGDKLAAALEASKLDVSGRHALDVGASTGGFTDCLLQAGAASVIAIDVGYGQLAWKLRDDPRVRVLERVNARYVTRDDLPDDLTTPPDLLVMDVAFISVCKLLDAVSALCATASDALILVKPQFESRPDEVGDGGVVIDAGVRRRALVNVARTAPDSGWAVVSAIPSPIRGAAGNWECFLQLKRPGKSRSASLDAIFEAIDIPQG